MKQRKIIHCDCDSFYASVEIRDNPSLKDVPLAVGGASDRRGVIATCNYIARRYGVKSAMPTAQALKLCPSLVVISGRMNAYREASKAIHDIFHRYTSKIEPLSLDEAYLDVSDADALHGSATLIAEDIRTAVRNEVGITISAGVAPNKFIAKIASDWNKPDGLTVITPNQVSEFVAQLDIAKLQGVGRVTEQKLKARGIKYCRDLLPYSEIDLVRYYGKFGSRLYQLARGIDDREVSNSRIRKSVSVETTYAEDLSSIEHWQNELSALVPKLKQRYDNLEQHYRITSFVVKLKYHDFSQHTVERQITSLDTRQFNDLLVEAHSRRSDPIRLLGIGFKLAPLASHEGFQYPLWPNDQLSFESQDSSP